jgi:hypothetical protein
MKNEAPQGTPAQVLQFVKKIEEGVDLEQIQAMRKSIQGYSVEMHDEWDGENHTLHRFYFWDKNRTTQKDYEYECESEFLNHC